MFLAVSPLASLGGRPLPTFLTRKHESRSSRQPAPSASVWSLDRGWSLSRGGLGPTQPGGGGGTPGRPGAQVRWETVSYPDRPCPQGNRGTCAPRWQAGPGWQERRRPWDRTEPSGREEGHRCSPRGTWTLVPLGGVTGTAVPCQPQCPTSTPPTRTASAPPPRAETASVLVPLWMRPCVPSAPCLLPAVHAPGSQKRAPDPTQEVVWPLTRSQQGGAPSPWPCSP